MGSPDANNPPISSGDDGELQSGLFCTRCGRVNPHETTHCGNCGDLLIEQGTDMRVRLARIRRYAGGTVHNTANPHSLDSRRYVMPAQTRPDDPLIRPATDQRRRLERIKAHASHVGEGRAGGSGIEFGWVILLSMFYSLFFPLIGKERPDSEQNKRQQ